MKILSRPVLLIVCCFLFLITSSNAQNLGTKEYQTMIKKVLALTAANDFEGALALHEKAFELLKKTHTETDSFYIANKLQLATLYIRLARFEQAEKLLLSVKKIALKAHGQQSAIYASCLNNLAILYWETQRMEDVHTIFEEVRETRRILLGEEHPEYAATLNNLAIVCRDLGYYQKAEALNLEALRIWENTIGKNNQNYTGCQNNLAVLYTDMGRETEAEFLFHEVKKARQEMLGEDDPQYALSVGNLGSLYFDMQEYEKAEKWTLEANQLWLKILGPNHPEYANNLQTLASIYSAMKKYDKAEALLAQAGKILLNTLGEQHSDYAMNIAEEGDIAKGKSDFRKAINRYLKSRDILLNTLGKQNSWYITNLNEIAISYLLYNMPDSAVYYAHAAIAANANSEIDLNKIKDLGNYNYNGSSQFLTSIHVLFDIWKKNPQNTGKLYALTEAALAHSNKKRQELDESADKIDLIQQLSLWEKDVLELGIKTNDYQSIERSFAFSEQCKSVVLMEALRSQEAHSFGDVPDSIITKEKTFQKQASELKAILPTLKDAQHQEALASLTALNKEISVFKKEIEKKYPKYNDFKYATKNLTINKIQEQLDPKTLLLAYTWLDSSLFVFSISKDQSKLTKILSNTIEINQQIELFRKTISDYTFITKEEDKAYQSYTTSAFWLYENLLKPVLLSDIQTLIIVPDGNISAIPFEALLTKNIKEKLPYNELPFLLNQLTISYNYSATLFVDALQNTKSLDRQPKILACAASYRKEDLNPNANVYRPIHLKGLRNGLQDLPAAKEEINKIAPIFEGKYLYGQEATEAFFKENAKDYDIIHLAMHGLLNRHHPLLSSLAFTENGDSLNDNFLQAFEISQLHLNAHLVVLSACETGYGKFVKGEGVMSLARSFMYAGVPSLVVSLWQVNDHSTAVVMELFYENLAEGMDKATALQQAKLKYLKIAQGLAAHPAFWSAFIQLGDSRPIILHEKINNWWWGMGIVTLLVTGIIFVIQRQKV